MESERIHRSSSFTAQRSAIYRGTGSKSLQGLRLVPPRVDTNPLISFYKASSRDPGRVSGYGKAGYESRTTHRYRLPRISSRLDIQEDIDRRYRFPPFSSRSLAYRLFLPFFFLSHRSPFPSFLSLSLSLPPSICRVVFQSSPKRLRKAHARSARVTRRGGRRGRVASFSFVRSFGKSTSSD